MTENEIYIGFATQFNIPILEKRIIIWKFSCNLFIKLYLR